jgi:hypothetical protein
MMYVLVASLILCEVDHIKIAPWDKRGNHSWLEGAVMVLSEMSHRILILSSQGGYEETHSTYP